MEYLNEYEKVAVIPAPPPSLPTGGPVTSTALWKKNVAKSTSAMRGLVSNFGPNSEQTEKVGSSELIGIITLLGLINFYTIIDCTPETA